MNIVDKLLGDYYMLIKAMHIISVICWMSAMFYLPRLFVYHSKEEFGTRSYETFCKMEVRLLKIIMNPSMILVYIFGFLLSYVYGYSAFGGWFYIKLFLVLCLSIFHGFCARCVRLFAENKNKYSEKFYRISNEIPVILMIIIVIMVTVKPLD